MKYTFLPKTKMGKVSVGSFVTFIATWTVYIVLIYPIFMTGTGKPALSDILLFSLSIAGIIAVFVGFVTGVIALFRRKDRSVLLIIVTLLCFLISGFMLLFMSEGFIS
jgi:hypothetical protein